jgi:type I restriction enzyme S subunit
MTDELPPGWARTDIGTLGKYINGRGFGKAEWRTSGLPIIRIQNLNDESASFNYSDQEHESKYRVKDGDLLISWAASLGVYVWNRGPAWLNQHIFRVEPELRVITQPFLYYSLNHALEALYKKTHGSGMVHVTKGKFDSHPINLPPINEQKRIVSKIDEIFSRIDEGERALGRAQKLVGRYRQSVLKAAVTGELTREWREKNNDKLESGEALLARILKARREAWEKAELARMKAKGIRPTNDLWKQKYKESPALDTSNLPELPSGWIWTNLAQIKLFSLYGPRFSSEDYAESGCLVLRTSDINESGRVNVATAPKLKLSKEEFQKYRAEKGDLLITRTGSLGTLALFDDDVDAIPGAYLIQYRVPAPSVTRWYLFHFLKSPVGQRRLLTGGAGIGRPNLNAPTIEAIPIPLPPLQEQGAIVDRIERALESADKQLELLAMEVARSRALRQATLKSAFSGDLVAQDSADEPASTLLARIAAECGTDNAAPKRGRKKKTAA